MEDLTAVTTEETNSATSVRGKAKSGRFWKDVQTTRHSAIHKSKPLKSTWQKKMDLKAKQNQAKLLQTDIRERRKQERQEKIERAKEQEERRIANEKKAEIVQVIRNTTKLKKTKKKQLRLIEKRDTTASS